MISNFKFQIFNKLISLVIFSFILFLPAKISALTISPPIFDLRAKPGETLQASLSLENETNSPLNLYGLVEAFNPTAKGGDLEFYPSEEGLSSWVALSENSLSLAPGESKKIFFTINVPAGTAGGSHYAAIFWGTSPPGAAPGGVAVASRLGALIFLNVEGTVIQDLEISNFKTTKKINLSLPIIFETSVKNKGNVYLAPKGEIIIKTWTGKQVAALPWNEAGLRALPGTERIISTPWGKRNILEELTLGIFGFYRASIHLSYGAPVKEAGDLVSFWILPLGGLGIFLLAVILGVLIISFAVRRYNKWIIRKHLESRK